MKERPVLFIGEMVRAILDGRKTQTRRVIKPQPNDWVSFADGLLQAKNPYGDPGDRLWVRETWQTVPRRAVSKEECWWVPPSYWPGTDSIKLDPRNTTRAIVYRADGEFPIPGGWRPSIFMPRWASRINLTIKDVRVERVQDITQSDAKAEGINPVLYDTYGDSNDEEYIREPGGFMWLWDSINAKRGYGWDKNPWVRVIEFEVEK
jgi:hypothetical protein